MRGKAASCFTCPIYSPDYNPIEEAFSKIKSFLRRAAARSKEALIEAMGAALSAVTVLRTPKASSSMLGIVQQVSYRETRCQKLGHLATLLLTEAGYRSGRSGWSDGPFARGCRETAGRWG